MCGCGVWYICQPQHAPNASVCPLHSCNIQGALQGGPAANYMQSVPEHAQARDMQGLPFHSDLQIFTCKAKSPRRTVFSFTANSCQSWNAIMCNDKQVGYTEQQQDTDRKRPSGEEQWLSGGRHKIFHDLRNPQKQQPESLCASAFFREDPLFSMCMHSGPPQLYLF